MTGGLSSEVTFFGTYEQAFVRRSHELLGLGYRRLDPGSLASLDETAITGHLCDAMETALDASDRPDWATQFTTIDDQPECVGGKTGKRRPRADVCVRCINPRPARRFRFEAKRLNSSRSLTEYLGDDGMLALLAGHYGDLPHAGMIGYVQTDTCPTWSGKIKAAITAEPSRYFATVPVQFADLGIAISETIFQSGHEHGSPPVRKRITHTLLQCS
jgi:hypothetical protein